MMKVTEGGLRGLHAALQKRFDKYVSAEPNTGCWVWHGAYDKPANSPDGGRPILCVGRGLQILVSRWLMGLASGATINGQAALACHTCDHPWCVNPAHLYVGTHLTNAQDKTRRKRNPFSNKTHCPIGHPYDEINTYWFNGKRSCRACGRESQARYLDRLRAARAEASS